MRTSLLILLAACVLAGASAQGGFMAWLETQYENFRRGMVRGILQTGSASRRRIDTSRQYTARSADSQLSTGSGSRSSSLRATSKYFNSKFQDPVPDSEPFPCPTEPGSPGGRSPTRPTSVHQLRAGDIDIVGAMGDSLTAGSGAAAANMVEVYLENRGMAWSAGGESSWKEYLTLPNILKEFNPNLIGYSLRDSLGSRKSSQFNVAEPIAIASDMPFQAKLLMKRMKSDTRVNYEEDWKLVTIMIGSNDFCGFMCYYKNYSEVVDRHRKDLVKTLDFLLENMPRTLVNFAPPPHLRIIQEFTGKPPQCFITHGFECPCLFGQRWAHLKDKFWQLMEEVQQLDIDLANSPRYNSREDFTVVTQPFLIHAQIPETESRSGDTITDYSYLSEDCFHFSQKTHALAGNSLWNNMLERVGNKTTHAVAAPFYRFLCPTEQHPYIYTTKNS